MPLLKNVTKIKNYDNSTDTGRRARGPGLCRLLNTSRTNCFDGNGNRTEDIEEFDGDDIEDQGTGYNHCAGTNPVCVWGGGGVDWQLATS